MWKEEWGDIKTFRASTIAEKLGVTVEKARALKSGVPLAPAPVVESEEDNVDHS